MMKFRRRIFLWAGNRSRTERKRFGADDDHGAGATFPYPIYSKWFDEYAKVDPSVRFNYQSIGSGGGQKQILAQTVDFGASDGPMSDDNLAKAPGKILHIPTVAGAVLITYNSRVTRRSNSCRHDCRYFGTDQEME